MVIMVITAAMTVLTMVMSNDINDNYSCNYNMTLPIITLSSATIMSSSLQIIRVGFRVRVKVGVRVRHRFELRVRDMIRVKSHQYEQFFILKNHVRLI
jgi:hypothetical protein